MKDTFKDEIIVPWGAKYCKYVFYDKTNPLTNECPIPEYKDIIKMDIGLQAD